ncbi:MAG TPA: HAD family phosphatase [Candidatus Pacearchaeota archaeon]|nr:HAD family phosphatase [Candidatus Pacearchaeota archaeon]HOK93992.1 HAD family phosphatase [Candidatus Pacearchaeota archaeon]HPO75063.1 HAD family phosphatase [Candidatus Pacearchaeota archaeon]
MNLDQIKGVVFDLDGVLVDTEYYQSEAWIEVLKQYKIFLSQEDLFEYKGKSAEVIENEFKNKYHLPIKKGELLKKRDAEVLKIFQKRKVKTMPYAKRTLEFFNKHKKLGLASTGSKKEVLLKLKKTGFYKYFSAVVSRDDVKKGKPCPDVYLAAVRKLKLKPKDCLAIEDTQSGVEAAKTAGLICFAIPNKFSETQNLSKADKILKNLKEVIREFS